MKKYIWILLSLIIGLAVLFLWHSMTQRHMNQVDRDPNMINISSAYIPATVPNANVGAGYVKIYNDTHVNDTLVSARSDAFGMIEIHSMTMDGDVMKMRKVIGGLEMPAGKVLELKPMGYHLMLMNLSEQLVAGTSYTIDLEFEKAPSIAVEFKVMERGSSPHEGNM